MKRYVERTVHGGRRQAEAAMARLTVEVGDSRYTPAAPMTFGELLDRWLAVKKPAVEASTLKSYEWVSTRYIRPELAKLADRKITTLRPIRLGNRSEAPDGSR